MIADWASLVVADGAFAAWTCQETSGDLNDSVGANDLILSAGNGRITYGISTGIGDVKAIRLGQKGVGAGTDIFNASSLDMNLSGTVGYAIEILMAAVDNASYTGVNQLWQLNSAFSTMDWNLAPQMRYVHQGVVIVGQTPGVFTDDVFKHVVTGRRDLISDGGHNFLVINGVDAASYSNNGGFNDNGAGLRIGDATNGAGQYFAAIAVYSTTAANLLTDARCAAHFAALSQAVVTDAPSLPKFARRSRRTSW